MFKEALWKDNHGKPCWDSWRSLETGIKYRRYKPSTPMDGVADPIQELENDYRFNKYLEEKRKDFENLQQEQEINKCS